MKKIGKREFDMEEVKKSISRKELKARAKQVVKAHYIFLVIICLLAVMIGTEFDFVRSNANNLYRIATGQDVIFGDTAVSLGGNVGPNFSVQVKDTSGESTGTEEASGEGDASQEGALSGYDYYSEEQGEPSGSDKVLSDLAEDNAEAGKAHAEEQLQEYQNRKLDNSVTGRHNGIFAAIANDISSGNLYMIIFDGLESVIHSSRVSSAIVVFASMLITICFWIFIKNMIQGILRRAFLEARTYEEVPISHLWHFKLVKRWKRASITLLVTSIFKYLWDLTIIGGLIKTFSYKLVPYIVAENPDIKPLDAITLSRRMMDGHKWECFKLDFTFILWYILGVFSMGIVDVLWTLPYHTATTTEYYTAIREEAKEKGVPGAEMLNDAYLFEKAEEGFLRKTYSDIEEQKKYIDEHRVTLQGKRAFFAKNFGLWTGSFAEKKAYDEVDNRRKQIAEDRAVIKGKIYPQRLNPRWDEKNNLIVRSLGFLRTYTIWSVILVFFAFAFVGWSWEVILHLVKDGVFVNRGVLHGPWLPIYGGGVAMIVVLLARWRSKPLVEAVSIVLLCGAVEYTTSWILELTKGMRWWDYTGYFLNINGRICGEGLLVFMVGGMAAVYLLIPVLDAMWSKMKPKLMVTICVILVVIFSADFIYSHYVPNVGEGITDYTAYEEAAPQEELPAGSTNG